MYITPHGNSFSNGLCILDGEELRGDLESFGHPEIEMVKKVDRELSELIHNHLDDKNMVSVLMDENTAKHYKANVTIDHGALVPMYFVDQLYTDYDIVHITTSGQDLESHYKMGVLIKEVIDQYEEKVLVVCSGDLSHALKSDGPYDYHEFGPKFDQMIVKAIEEKNPMPIFELTNAQERDAAQCGLRSFLMGFGMMDGHDYHSEIHSYEGPFGVGYLTGYLANDFLSIEPSLLKKLEDRKQKAYSEKLQGEDPPYVKLARRSIETYVRYHRKPAISERPSYLPEEIYDELLSVKAGAFVSIHKNDRLRGCIGTTESTSDSLFDEIIYCAISACSADPRFNPISENELMDLEIKVDRLYPPEPIFDLDELDVMRYGVIVEQDRKRGLLLPNLDGVDTIEQQVSIAKQKAGIDTDEGIDYYRFEVERHG